MPGYIGGVIDDPKNPGPEPYDEQGMTVRQRRFADEFIEILADPDVKSPKREAAIRAGYAVGSASAHAYRCMQNPNVMAYIGRHIQATTARIGIDRSYVLFKAVVATELAEAQGNIPVMLKALEVVGRHTDVAAFDAVPGQTGTGDGAQFARALEALNRDDVIALAGLLARMGFGGAPRERDGAGSGPPTAH